jgi:threonine/homoserine/homoserine lactone efflux protein
MDWINLSLIALFIPTSIFISLTPGMCMTLALALGINIGLKRTFYMMWGELLGVGIVATFSVIGAATIMLNFPSIFTILKYVGGAYLIYLGVELWRSRGKMAINYDNCTSQISNISLATQGFITAISNPKGWAFFIAFIPPFIDQSKDVVPQFASLILIILIVEFISLVIYASGGNILKKILENRANVQIINRISGTLMILIGLWLAFG